MEEMVEPDRTIMIVSIIGLVIIWGSVLYHKFVQGGNPAAEDSTTPPAALPQTPGEGVAAPPRKKKK
ncbi:MAG: hypothetical protein IT369_15215 [Candidatus Latescibacteria bacterium]|nr:hypothetical protein [Candidatus Latescibacterota bacterium]